MAPTELERLATLESDSKNTRTLLREIKMELRRLPRRISKNTEEQLALCRATQDGKRVTKAASAPKDDDYSWLKKLLVVGMTIGTLIGGAVYQVTQEKSSRPNISQGGNP
jgi:preprotein translocase subunit Sss1